MCTYPAKSYIYTLTLLLFHIFHIYIRCICHTTISLLRATTWSTKAGQNCTRTSRFAHQERQGGVRRSVRGGRALPYSTLACVRPYIRLSICVSAGALWELAVHCGPPVGGLCVHRCTRRDRRHGHPRDPMAAGIAAG